MTYRNFNDYGNIGEMTVEPVAYNLNVTNLTLKKVRGGSMDLAYPVNM